MVKTIKNIRNLLVVLAFLSVNASAQDLGSSNGLFKPTNPKSKKQSPPAQKKPVAAKAPPAKPARAKKNAKTDRTAAAASERPAPGGTSAKTAEKIPPPANEIIITVGQPASGDFNEIYEQAIEAGNLARDHRDYKTAESEYKRAQAVKIKDFRAIYGLGNVYSDQQRWEEAERSYREAIRLSPDSAEPFLALSYVLTQPLSGTNLSSRFLEAQKTARRAIELDPANPAAFDQLGIALELSGNIDQATRDAYLRAIRLDPGYALAYAHLGRLLRRQGNVKKSDEYYEKAVELARDVPTMIQVAEVLQSQQRFAVSENLLRRALVEDPKHPTALNFLGRALMVRSAYAEAEKVLKKSVEISPSSVISNSLLSSVYLRKGEIDRAERVLNQALGIVPESEKKYLAKDFEAVGDDFLRTGKKIEAVRAYKKALLLDGGKQELSVKIENASKFNK